MTDSPQQDPFAELPPPPDPDDDHDGDGQGDDDSHGGKPSAATMLIRLALARYTLGCTDDDDVYAVPTDGPPVARMLRGGRGSLRAELARAYYQATGRAAPQQALSDALMTLEGQAREADPVPLALRVAKHDGALWLDLGDPTGRAVQIRPDGWTVVDRPPVLFRRTETTGALPAPAPAGGDGLTALWARLNVRPAYRPLLLAWLVAALMPGIPHPVLTFRGEHGTGKTTAARTLAGVLDPSPVAVRTPPKDADGWVTAAAGSWVVAVDNVSHVSDWWSDSLCRAVTGDGAVRRRLYTDGGLAVFAFRRCIVLTGIDYGAVRGDLADRLLDVELDVIDPAARLSDEAMTEAWARDHPAILAAVLDIAAQALAALPRVRLDTLPRMADFALVLAAVDHVAGTSAAATYSGQAQALAADAIDSDPAMSAIRDAVAGRFDGTARELLDLITPTASPDGGKWRPPRDWPRNARALAALLKRNAPGLRLIGWTADGAHHDRKGAAVWTLIPPTPGRDDPTRDDSETTSATSATSANRPRPAVMPADVGGANVGATSADVGNVGTSGARFPHECRRADVADVQTGSSQDDSPPRSGDPELLPWDPPTGDPCPHGMPGGTDPDPWLNGRAACPKCAMAGTR